MKITHKKISDIVSKYLPEHKGIIFKPHKKRIFESFIGYNEIRYPTCVCDKMEEYPREIVLIASVLHEIGHLVSTKKHPTTIKQLVKTEGEAQKWAIEKAIELNLSVVAKCLIEEFATWIEEEFDNQTGNDPLYGKCNPYHLASEQNEEWINTKVAEVFD